jgi:hypothetical protein
MNRVEDHSSFFEDILHVLTCTIQLNLNYRTISDLPEVSNDPLLHTICTSVYQPFTPRYSSASTMFSHISH